MVQRSKVAKLPQEVRSWLDKALIDGNFSEYKALEVELKARGFSIGKSSIGRYGQKLEEKLAAIKASTEAAKAIAEAAPDDSDLRSSMSISLVQTGFFDVLMKINSGDMEDDPGEYLKLLTKASKGVSELSRASVNQKKWQIQMEAKIREEERARAAAEVSAATKEAAIAEGLSPEQASRLGNAAANRIQIYLPDNGRR